MLMDLFKRGNSHLSCCKIKLNSFAGLEYVKCTQAFINMQIKTCASIL